MTKRSAILPFLPFSVLLCASGCAGAVPAFHAPPLPAKAAPEAREASLRFDDHLAFGLRLESIAVRMDGRSVYSNLDAVHTPVPRELAAIPLLPGVHSVRVQAQVSLACGLLDEPRTRVSLVASNNFRATGGPASVGIDLFARAPVTRRTEPAVQFQGRGVVLGLRETRDASDAVHPSCTGLEPVAVATCDVEAFVAEARASRDVAAFACYGKLSEEMHRMRDVLDDATLVTGSDQATNDLAMHAQLRAIYASARIRKLAVEARQCTGADGLATLVATADEAQCPPQVEASEASAAPGRGPTREPDRWGE